MSSPWWVIPEGTLGKIVNALGPGITLNLYTVTQSPGQPPGAVAGPFATQAAAQTRATQINQSGANQATLPNIATSAATSASGALSGTILGPLFQGNIWLRVGEVVLGLVLIAVGVAKLTGAVPIATKVAKTAGAVALV